MSNYNIVYMYCNNHLWDHCKNTWVTSIIFWLSQLLYLLCAWHVWSSRDASSLKQRLNIVVKLLTFVRVFLQKSYNISYTPAISMQPRSSSTQGQMCRIKENTKPHQMCWLIGLLQNISKAEASQLHFNSNYKHSFNLWRTYYEHNRHVITKICFFKVC